MKPLAAAKITVGPEMGQPWGKNNNTHYQKVQEKGRSHVIVTSHVFKKKEQEPPQSLWLAHEELLTSLSNEVNIYRLMTGNCYPPEMRKVPREKVIQYKKN